MKKRKFWLGIITFLLIFGLFKGPIISAAQEFVANNNVLFRIIIFIILIIILLIVLFKDQVPNLILVVTMLYMSGWFLTISYTSTSNLSETSKSSGFNNIDETIYWFNEGVNFFVVVIAFISLYVITNDRKKAHKAIKENSNKFKREEKDEIQILRKKVKILEDDNVALKKGTNINHYYH